MTQLLFFQIAKEIEEMKSQTADSWDPHAILKFLKVKIQSVFSLKVSDMRNLVNGEIKETEEELNQIENSKLRDLSRPDISQEERNQKVDTLEKAVTSLKSKLLNSGRNSAIPWHLCQEQNVLNMAKNQRNSS